MRKVKNAYGKRVRCGIDWLSEEGVREPGMTEQCHKTECDIGSILRKYDKTGLLTHVNKAVADYGDFSEVNEYKESLNKVIAAQEAFGDLPSGIRKKFGNDPGNYLEFVSEPKNKEEMIKLGLANAEVEEAIPKVEIVNMIDALAADKS